jgi:hypothetical protein
MNANDDTCPRCTAAFHCGVADTTPCPCTRIVLGPETLAALRARYTSCLCLSCLAELAAAEQKGRPDLAIGRP